MFSASRGQTALLLHDDDLGIDARWPLADVKAVAVLRLLPVGDPQGPAAKFRDGCAADAAHRASVALNVSAGVLTPDRLVAWAKSHRVERIVTPYAPTGLTAWVLVDLRTALADDGMELHTLIRPWDRVIWPHATRGFF